MIFLAQSAPGTNFLSIGCDRSINDGAKHAAVTGEAFHKLSLPRRFIFGSSLPGREDERTIFLSSLINRGDNLVERRHLAIADKLLGKSLPSCFRKPMNLFLRVKLFEFRHVSS